MRISGFALFAAFLAGFLFVSASAKADDDAKRGRTSSLSWIRMPGAESCVPTQELARDVEVRLARTVFVSASQADVSIEGRVEKKTGPSRWHATIILRDAKGATIGTRELDRQDASCDGMREQLALVIAVMIDPDAALAHHATPDATPPNPTPTATTTTATTSTPPPPPPPTASATQNPPPPPPPHQEDKPKSPQKKAEPWFFEASAAAFGEVGLTPNPGFGLGVSTLLEAPHIPIALDGAAVIFFDNTATATDDFGKTASTGFTLAYLSGGLCPLRARSDRFHAFGCLISQLGLLRAQSQGYANAVGDKLAVLYNIGLEGRASLRIAGPFALRAGVSWVVPLIRFPFDYDRGTTSVPLFQVAPVALTGDLGLGFEFP